MLRELNEDLMTQMHFVEFFFYVTNNKEVDFNNPQMMHCILCCNNHVIGVFNTKI
jgi:hypothetical protein